MSTTHPAQVTVTTNGVTRSLASDLDLLAPTAAMVTPAAPGAVARTVSAKLSDVTSINDFGIGDPTATINILENGRVSQLPYIDPFAWWRMDQFTGPQNPIALLGEKQETAAFSRASVAAVVVGGVETIAASGQIRFQDNPPGMLVETSRTNLISVPDAPVNQTGLALVVTSYYLRIEGTGSITVTLVSGTAPLLPLTVTAATPAGFAVTVSATVNITVTGSVTFAQLESGNSASGIFPTSRIHTASTRQPDYVSLVGALRNGRDWIVAIRAQPSGGFNWAGSEPRGLFTIGDATNTANTAFSYVNSDGTIVYTISDNANAVKSLSLAKVFLGNVEHEFWFYGSQDGKMEAWIDGQRVAASITGAGTGIITTMPSFLRPGDAHFAAVLQGVVKDAKIYYDTTPERLPQPQWTRTITANTVACVGDSITAGQGVTTPYPTTLQTTLSAGSTGAWTVLNAGNSGDYTHQALMRWGSGVRRQTHKYVVLFAGTNDINAGYTAATAWNNLTKAATQVRTDGKSLVLVTIIPRNTMTVPLNAERVKLNVLIRAYCAAGKAILVDADPLFDNGDGTTIKPSLAQGDGIHPNQAGADLIAATVAAAIPH